MVEAKISRHASYILLRQAGAGRVADPACDVLSEALVEYGLKVGKIAIEIAKTTPRNPNVVSRTLKARHVKTALKILGEK